MIFFSVGTIKSTPLSTTVTVLEGNQEWILIKTDLKRDLTHLGRSCHFASFDETCPASHYDGGPTQYRVNLREGDTLYIPEGWSYIAKTIERATTVWEKKLLSPGIENYAALPTKTETHQLNVNKLIKFLQSDDLLVGMWRRITKVIKQINTAKVN